MTGATAPTEVPAEPGRALAAIADDLHQRLRRGDRWVRIGDVLRLITPHADAGTPDPGSTS